MFEVQAPPAPAPVPRLGTAEEQIRYAVSLKSALRGQDGDVRREGRLDAVRAYRAVREYFPRETAPACEAAFRAAELLRSSGESKAALEEFGWVRANAGESPFRLRAILEIGHLQRRGRQPQDALTAYEAVFSDSSASKRQKDDASLWIGVVSSDLERYDDARRAWQRVAEAGEDPLDRIRAFDHLALLAVLKADLEAAAGILERCRAALEDVAAEETKLGERVRSAITSMRAHDELQRAVAERERARTKPRKESGI